eukprot:gene765-biopygen9276
MNSCHKKGARYRNRTGIEAAAVPRWTNGKGHLKVWEGWGAA